MRGITVMLLLILTLSSAPAAAADAALAEKARILLDYHSFMRGDRDGAVRFALNASRDMQNTPIAELAARLALFYDPGALSSVTVGEAEARRILGADASELSPEYRDLLRRFLARNLAAAGRRDEALQVHRRRGLVMSWLLAGPFTGRKGAGFDVREIPESGEIGSEDVIADPPDAAKFKEWRRTPPWRALPENRAFPYVRPWRRVPDDADGAMLMFTALELETADNKASFHVISDASWRLYIDGVLVAELDRDSREVPAEHMVPFSLTAGRHAVMLHVFPPGAGVDPYDVRVALRLESESSFTWNRDLAPPSRKCLDNSRREPRRMRYLLDLAAVRDESPILAAAYSLACLEQGMRDEAAWWAEKAARADSGDVNLQFIAGIMTSLNPQLPEERRRDIAGSWHRKTLEMNDEIIPSLLFLAESASAGGKSREAAKYIERAHKANANSLDVLLARGEWASRFATGSTARAAWDECAKAFPKSSSVQVAIASQPQDGFQDMDRRLAACRAAVEAGAYVPEASLRLAEALSDSGNSQEAESVLRNALDLFSGEVGVLVRISEVYARLGLYKQAIEVMSEAVRLVPESDVYWRELGDLHMESGAQDEAVRLWMVSLAANPGQFELSDMMNFLSGKPGRLTSEGEYDAIAMTAGADTSRFPGDVVRLLDRAVIMFARDGSYRRLTHEIDLARNRRGGESLAGIDRRGELLTARIVFPNGNTLEPEPFPGQGGLRLPVIMPGASREVRTLESVARAWDDPPTIKPWFFQDPSGRMPLLISEYEVRAPKGFPLVYVMRDLGSNVDFEFTQEEETDVYRWTANLSLPRREPDAVHISERVPSVEIGVKTTWDEVVFRELRKLDGRLTPSMRMQSLLDTLYRPNPGAKPEPEQAARAIYRYVCDNIDPTPTGEIAAHVHVDQMGDRNLLLLALLRAAGLDANPAAARPSVTVMHPPAWDLPNRDIFPISMVRLHIPGGKTYYLDTRYDSLPFGRIADDLSGATVLSFLTAGPLFETLPVLPAEDSVVLEERSLRLPGKGESIAVVGRSSRRGAEGLRWGQELADADVEMRRRMVLSALFPVFPDAVLQRFDALRPDDNDASSQVRYEITSATAVEERPEGVMAIPLCLLPPQVIADDTRNLAHRRTTCHIKSVHMAEDRSVFLLPEGGSFVRLPESAHIPTRFGVYQLRVTPRGDNGVEVVRNYHIPAQRVSPWDWEDFLAFLKRIDLAERQWIEYSAP